MDWEEIAASGCQNLIESMPRRVQAVLKAKGGLHKILIHCQYLLIIKSSKTLAMS